MAAAMAPSGPYSRLPQLQTGGIYAGRTRDSTPSIRAAGKFTASTGESTHQCLNPPLRPDSPEVIRKFHNSEQLYTDPGQTKVFYGKAYDPHLKWAKDMTHGASTTPSYIAGDLVNPPPNTLFRQRTIDKKEDLYRSHQKGPLGKSHDQAAGFPPGFPYTQVPFGMKYHKDGNAGELVNPDFDHYQVMANSEAGRELYIKTHADLRPGEQHDRGYTSPGYHRYRQYGIPTPHDNAGKLTKRSMRWLTDEKGEQRTPIVTRRVDMYRERTQPQIGKVLDPIKDTMNVAPDHTFGLLLKPDKYGAGDLIHYRLPDEYLRGKDRIRGVVAAMRQQLKKENFQNFENLLEAFRYYDPNNTGRISKENLSEVCLRFRLPADEDYIEAMMSACIPDAASGMIDYCSFINFLNWKDKMPDGLPKRDSKWWEKLVHTAPQLNKQPLADRASPPLTKQIDRQIGEFRTTSAGVSAVVGGVDTRRYRTYGVPTIRSDIPAPRLRRVSDRTNYGDCGGGGALLNPSMYTNLGVTEQHFFEPRSRQELRKIFANVGVDMTFDNFDALYDLAASMHPRGTVCVETFRAVLDQAHGIVTTHNNVDEGMEKQRQQTDVLA